jgi:hypothetical protein
MAVTMLLLALLAAAGAARAGTEAGPTVAPPLPSATVAASHQVDFTSAVNGRSYRIQVAVPLAAPPAQGFPVLYVLDGDGYFGTYAFAARLRAMSREIEPAVVVGIGYPDAEANLAIALARRQYDLTPTDADAETRATAAKTGAGGLEYGGADAFLKVIEQEVKPRVAEIVPVDPRRDILYGHSLGGLFALHAMFTHPGDFQTYLVLSPSIWWDHRAVLKDEEAFRRLVLDGRVTPRLLLAVGGTEQTTPTGPLPPGMTRADVARFTADAAMVDNARMLARRLISLRGTPPYEVRLEVLDGESHASVAWAVVNHFLNFALQPVAVRASPPPK